MWHCETSGHLLNNSWWVKWLSEHISPYGEVTRDVSSHQNRCTVSIWFNDYTSIHFYSSQWEPPDSVLDQRMPQFRGNRLPSPNLSFSRKGNWVPARSKMTCPRVNNWFVLKQGALQCPFPMQNVFLPLAPFSSMDNRRTWSPMSPVDTISPLPTLAKLNYRKFFLFCSYLILAGSESCRGLKKARETEMELELVSLSPIDSFCVGLNHNLLGQGWCWHSVGWGFEVRWKEKEGSLCYCAFLAGQKYFKWILDCISTSRMWGRFENG